MNRSYIRGHYTFLRIENFAYILYLLVSIPTFYYMPAVGGEYGILEAAYAHLLRIYCLWCKVCFIVEGICTICVSRKSVTLRFPQSFSEFPCEIRNQRHKKSPEIIASHK